MNLLNKLTINNLKLNKKRSIVTIIGIMLSVALITAVASMYSSFLESTIIYEKHVKGNYHVKLSDVPFKDLESLKNNSKIASISIMKRLGYFELENSKNEYKPYGYVLAFDELALNDLKNKIIEGRLPKNNREIVISEHLINNGQVASKIGDEITLNIGKRVQDNYELNQDNPYNYEQPEMIINKSSKTYKVVGIVKRPVTVIEPYNAPGYTYITYLEDNEKMGSADLFLIYNKKGVKDNYTVTANILGIDADIFKEQKTNPTELSQEAQMKIIKELSKAKYKYAENNYLLKLETNPLTISTNKNLGVIAIVVCFIIIFTSVFCIKNSFDISITEKTKQYGMLKSVGATKRQIKKNVLFEAMILGSIGIPLGVLCGLLASFILIKLTNILLFKSLADDLVIYYKTGLKFIIISIILGIVTIYFSSIRSAKKASKVSSIELIRNSGNIKINNKLLKTPKIIKNMFGIGGVISYKNLKRNKKKYRTTVISLTISIATFIGLFYFTTEMNRSLEQEFKTSPYNYSFIANDYENNKDKIEQITKIDGIKDFSITRTSLFDLKSPNFNKNLNPSLDEEAVNINVYCVGNAQYQKYLKKLGLNLNEAKNKAILIDFITEQYTDKGKTKLKTSTLFNYQKGDILDTYLDIDGQINFKFELIKVTNIAPFGINAENNVSLIISDDLYDSLNINNDMVNGYFDAINADKIEKETKELLKSSIMNSNNNNESKKQIDSVLLLINIFLYGFITVISLIGITNIFNTITTNMELRKQEFAMLKSIGMTKKEFNKMINLESLFMGSKALLYGIFLGSVIAYIIYHLNEELAMTFKYPFGAVLICILIVMVIISSLMKYSIKKINKQNTIETIRNENI